MTEVVKCQVTGCGGRIEFDTDSIGRVQERCPKCERRASVQRAKGATEAARCSVPLCGGYLTDDGNCRACEKRRAAFPAPPPRPKTPKAPVLMSRTCEVCDTPVERQPRGAKGRLGHLPKLCAACRQARDRYKQREWLQKKRAARRGAA